MPRKGSVSVEALSRAAQGREAAAVIGEACAVVAERLGLEMSARWLPTAVDPRVRAAVSTMTDDEARDPARTLGAALEAILQDSGGRRSTRKKTGAYYTPASLVEYVLDAGLDGGRLGVSTGRGVHDPACGSGLFLVGAMRRLARRIPIEEAARCVSGMDVNPAAVLLARFAMWLECSGAVRVEELERNIRVGDALMGEDGRCYDAIVGNPPFLNQLETATAHGAARAKLLQERYGEAARCYADTAGIFLAMAVRRVRSGGRVSLVQPQSLLSARDAEPTRRAVLDAGVLAELWVAQEHVFGASVLVCVPTVRVGDRTTAKPVVRAGGDYRKLPPSEEQVSAASWAPLVASAHGIPEFEYASSGVLGDIAEATADFRDQFYGLRGCIVEDSVDPDAPRVVTTGLIDPAACLWGERATRIDGHRWEAPRADLDLLGRDPEMARWARQRLVPKVLLATQTRVLEAAVDAEGLWLPVTPLITVRPRDPVMLWTMGALLCSPVLSAIGLRRHAGAGLSASAIKLSAKQVLQLPIPEDADALLAAGELFREASHSPARRADLLRACALQSCRAYRVSAVDDLMDWWSPRLPRGRERGGKPQLRGEPVGV
jgi:hypothetical protein